MAEDLGKDLEQKISLKFETNADDTSKQVSALSGAIEHTTDAQQESAMATQKTELATNNFKTQIREATQEMMKASQTYGETSKEAVTAAKKVAELKDQMAFSKDLVDKFNPDQKFKALTAATSIAATSMSGITSGMALFGDQSADTQKQLLKVQAAMAFSQAISGLSDLGDQWKTLKTTIAASTVFTMANTAATTIASGVTRLFGASVAETSVGFKVLKGAIISTGIGALVIGITMLIQNFDKVKEVMLNLVPGLGKVANSITGIVQSVTDFIGVTSNATRATDRLKENADASLALNKKFLAEHGSQLDEFTKQKIEAKNKYNEAVKEAGADQKALAAELNRELAQIEYSRGDEARKIQAEQHEKDVEAQQERAKGKADKLEAEAKAEAKAETERKRKIYEDAQEEELKSYKVIQDAKKANENSLKTDQQRKIDEENTAYQLKFKSAIAFNQSTEDLELEHLNKINDINLEAQNIAYQNLDESNKKTIAQEQALADSKKATQEQTLNVVSSGISMLQSLGIKNKAIQKGLLVAESAVGIAKIIQNTSTANAVAIASPFNAVDPSYSARMIAMNYVSAGIGIASNVAATAKGLQALGGGGGDSNSSSSVGSPSTSGSASPQVGFQNSNANQIGQTVAQNTNEQPPIKAYVVSHEVTTAQNIENNHVKSNSI